MDWKDALEIAVTIKKNERFRELTSDNFPSEETRISYRNLVVAIAENQEIPGEVYGETPADQNTQKLADAALAAALIAQEFPDGVNMTGIPIGRKCCG